MQLAPFSSKKKAKLDEKIYFLMLKNNNLFCSRELMTVNFLTDSDKKKLGGFAW